MRQLYEEWIDNHPALSDVVLVEQPPSGFEQIAPISRAHTMEHPALGVRDDVPSEDVEHLRSQGWRLVLAKDDFLELVHLQAWYFQVRFFPRLRWMILDAPTGRHFIVSDRPVVWGFDGRIDVPPSALRHADVQRFATLTSSAALFACHPSVPPPQAISYVDVNRVIASAAQEWIADPTRDVVVDALSWRLDA